MSKKTVIPIVLILLIFGIYIVVSSVLGKFRYNDGSFVGNTAGNLYNKGLFAECGGRVYFSNRNDSGTLYSMNADETDYKKLIEANVTYINADKNHVYYFQDSSVKGNGDLSHFVNMTGIYRTGTTGKQTVCLDRTPACMLVVIGNYVYYENIDNKKGTELSKICIDKKSPSVLLADHVVDPSSVMGQCFYYAGMQDDHNLYVWDTRTDTSNVLLEGSVFNPIATADAIYYMNVADNYRLYRCNTDGSSPVKLTDDRVDTYNVVGNMIYYQKNSTDSPALMRMALDGSSAETVMDGNYTCINSTSEYVYFLRYDTTGPFYQTPVNGAVNVTSFNPDIISSD